MGVGGWLILIEDRVYVLYCICTEIPKVDSMRNERRGVGSVNDFIQCLRFDLGLSIHRYGGVLCVCLAFSAGRQTLRIFLHHNVL